MTKLVGINFVSEGFAKITKFDKLICKKIISFLCRREATEKNNVKPLKKCRKILYTIFFASNLW